MSIRVSAMSDLHLEFNGIELPGGDILLLAGDILRTACLRAHKTDAESRKERSRYERFAKKELAKYGRVFAVMGNHEFYGDLLESAAHTCRQFLAEHAPHASLLDDEWEIHEDFAFIGSTLWATYGNGTPAEFKIHHGMNDFYRIRTAMPPDGAASRVYAPISMGRSIRPSDLAARHKKAIKFLKKTLAMTKKAEMPSIVITHHAPSLLSKSEGFCDDRDDFEAAYYSNQHKLIQANSQLYLWLHGHTHHSCHYTIGKTRIISNQRGYFPDEPVSRHFDPNAEDFNLDELQKL